MSEFNLPLPNLPSGYRWGIYTEPGGTHIRILNGSVPAVESYVEGETRQDRDEYLGCIWFEARRLADQLEDSHMRRDWMHRVWSS